MASLLDLISNEEHTITNTPYGEPENLDPKQPENVPADGNVQNGKEEKSDETSTDVEGAEDALIGKALEAVASLETVNRTLNQFVKQGIAIDHESLVAAYRDISKAYASQGLKEPAPLVLSIESHQSLDTRTKMVQELVLSVEGQINALLKNVQMIQDNRVARIKARVASISQEALHPEVSTEEIMTLGQIAISNKTADSVGESIWNDLTKKQMVYLPFEARDVSFFKAVKVDDEDTLIQTLRDNLKNMLDGKDLKVYPLSFRSWKNAPMDQNSTGNGYLVRIDIPMTDRKQWREFCDEINDLMDEYKDKSGFWTKFFMVGAANNHSQVHSKEDQYKRFAKVLEHLYKKAKDVFGF
nr:MAG TPA: hypothetical protein [Caudoviricetes sp.]